MTGSSSIIEPDKPTPAGKPVAVVRIAAALGAAALFAFALAGYLNPASLAPNEYWWLMVVAAAIAVAGWTLSTEWQRAGILAAIFLIGFGAQLSLRDPYWFQHIRILPTGFSYVMTAAIGAQGVVALLHARTFGWPVRIMSELGWFRVLLVALVLILASKSAMDFIATGTYARFFKHLVIASAFLVINLVNFAALLAALPGNRLSSVAGGVSAAISLPGGDDRVRRFDSAFPLCVAGAVFATCVLITFAAFEAVPHLDDIIYLFHARYFADGMLALPLPPSTEAFGHYLLDTHDGKWFTANLPGWPLALAIGILVGMPWVISPLAAGASVLLVHRVTRSMIDRGTANLVILLMAISPWYLSISSTGLLHTFTYALILGAWVLLLKSRERPSFVLPLIAGLLMGWLFLSRPLEGIYMGLLTWIWTLTFLKDRSQWKTVILYSLGCIAIGGLLFPYNAYLTGDPLLTPLNAYLDEFWGPGSNALGFGPNIGPPNWGNVDALDGHSPLEALINADQNLYELNSELYGWGGFSLLFALVFVLWGKWTAVTRAMAAIVIVTFAVYCLYWYVGGFYTGPRYWFMMLVPLLIFTALGIGTSIELFSRLYPDADMPQRIGVGVAFLGVCSVLVFESWLCLNKFPEINGFHDEYEELAGQDELRNSLVFIASDNEEEYSSAIWLNDFGAKADTPLFAKDLGPQTNRLVAAAYPGRKIFFVDGRSSTRDHVTITRGPLSLGDLE
ncbi:MAG: hypothetical protein R3E44_04690 [Paracoccaceae bacterium]